MLIGVLAPDAALFAARPEVPSALRFGAIDGRWYGRED